MFIVNRKVRSSLNLIRKKIELSSTSSLHCCAVVVVAVVVAVVVVVIVVWLHLRLNRMNAAIKDLFKTGRRRLIEFKPFVWRKWERKVG